MRAGLEKDKACLLVIVGALRDGRKELLACTSGHRESTESGSELLRDLGGRGLSAPMMMIGDGALGIPGTPRACAHRRTAREPVPAGETCRRGATPTPARMREHEGRTVAGRTLDDTAPRRRDYCHLYWQTNARGRTAADIGGYGSGTLSPISLCVLRTPLTRTESSTRP